jgi:hypothetical protein
MKHLFGIAIGYDEKDKRYIANVHSITDNKLAPIEDTSARRMLAKMVKLVRAKTQEVKNFPLPEPSRIIRPNRNGAPKLVVLPNGR